MTSEAERIPGLYERHALAFDRLRGRGLIEAKWLDRFLALLPPEPAVLDIGCGSGEPIAAHLVAGGCAITGVDSAPTLIGLCRARLPQQDWRIGDMRKLALGRRFDGLIAWNSFFHLTPADQERMFPVFAAHASARGALMFTSGPAHGEAIGEFEGEPLYHGSLAPKAYRALLQASGFHVVAHAVEDPDCGRLTVWLAQRGEA